MIGRKILSGLGGMLIALLCMALMSGCGEKGTTVNAPDPAKDVALLEEKKVMVVGITDYFPIDYQEGDSWTGFDAELCQNFASWLCGAQVRFELIDWDEKTELLEKGDIDCIWNAMTKTSQVEAAVDCSEPYLYSAEVMVLPQKQFEHYSSQEQCFHLLFAVEDGSSAQKMAEANKLRTIAYKGQNSVLDAVMKKECDAAIVDKIFATLMTGADSSYDSLIYGFPFSTEEICVGLRKGSSLTAKVNEYLTQSKDDGSLLALAQKYGLLDVLEP